MADRAQTRRPIRVNLSGEFEGWAASVDSNFTLGQLGGLSSGKLDRVSKALGEMLIDWNFTDKDGNPLPANAEGIDGLTMDLVAEFTNAITAVVSVPNR